MEELGVEGDLSIAQAVADHVIDDVDAPREPGLLVQLAEPTEPTRSGFFDPDNPSDESVILLKRLTETSASEPIEGRERLGRLKRLVMGLKALLVERRDETFKLEKPIGYRDPNLGAIIVPRNLAHFRTDLTSVPRFFTWLIPKTGVHLPAAILHDGLVHPRNEPPTYIAAVEIDRVTADDLFRKSMRGLGTSWLRRWFIWSAVAIVTAVSQGPKKAWYWWLVLLVTGGVIVVAGTMATFDLFDCREPLPWMADRPWWTEILTGAAGAVIASIVLAIPWGRLWRAGLLLGLGLSLLLHVTAAVLIVTAVFTTAEAVTQKNGPRATLWLLITGAAVVPIVVIGAWAC